MICPHCNKTTQGTETFPGTVSSTCPTCNRDLTGRSHHPDAYDHDAAGNLISATPAALPDAAPIIAKAKARR